MIDLKDVKFCDLTSKDTNSILNLINIVQPEIPWSKEYLNWQYFNCPAGNAKIFGLKNNNNEVVSLYSSIPYLIQFNEHIIEGSMAQDAMTHPNYRNRGYLHYLGELCLNNIKKDYKIGFAFPNEKSEKSLRRSGWKEFCLVPERKKLINNMVKTKHDLNFEEINENFDDTISDIWKNSDQKIGLKRDQNYLNWRYNKPGEKYFKFIINKNEGILILKIFNKKVLHLCDLFVKKDKINLVSDILIFSENFGKKNNCEAITAWLPKDHKYSTFYDKFKLILTLRKRYMFITCENKKYSDLISPEKWYLSQGDSDVY